MFSFVWSWPILQVAGISAVLSLEPWTGRYTARKDEAVNIAQGTDNGGRIACALTTRARSEYVEPAAGKQSVDADVNERGYV